MRFNWCTSYHILVQVEYIVLCYPCCTAYPYVTYNSFLLQGCVRASLSMTPRIWYVPEPVTTLELMVIVSVYTSDMCLHHWYIVAEDRLLSVSLAYTDFIRFTGLHWLH